MATIKEDEDKQQEEYVVVEDPKKLSAAAPEDTDDIDPDNPDDDERVASSAHEESSTDKEREAIRERRRLEKIERKERRDAAIKRDKLELDFLVKRNDELERRLLAQEQRSHQSEVNTLAQQAKQAAYQAEQAERVIAKAIEAGNGEDVATAMRYRDEARQRAQQLAAQAQYAQQNVPQPKPQGPDERVLQNARAFMEENKSWYDPQGRNEESAIVLAIDNALVKDGFDPKSDEYWSELRKRAARRLPEKFKNTSRVQTYSDDDDDARTSTRVARGGPAVGSGREHAPASTRKEVYISPERKQALIEAGVWDDPVLRQKYVKRYAEYDKNNRA